MQANNAANAYARLGVQTEAMTASPHRLIVMLFDGAHVALTRARWAAENGDIAVKGSAISKAVEIIERGLRAGLDADQGGDIAANLDRLYDYMTRTLITANRTSDAKLIGHVDELLGEIGTAWKQIGGTEAVEPAPA